MAIGEAVSERPAGSRSPRSRAILGGARVDLLDVRGLMECVAQRLDPREGEVLVVASANLDHVYRFGIGGLHPDPAGDSSNSGWLVTLDGVPLVWAARLLTGTPWPQLAGSDLLEPMLDLAESAGVSVGFLGGWPDQHRRLQDLVPRRWPSLRLAGFWSPGPEVIESSSEARALAEEIAGAAVDLLVVGLGKPRQEQWLARYGDVSGAKVALAFGAAADFLAGSAQRAPGWTRRLGLEWLYRLLREPRRLWRRYLVQGPVALWRLLRWSERPRS
jgi:N-acetylglucosaminyldiphosphoundecaprenol N-acetyl-beta-D-mannosaminyltransferase